MPKRGFSPDFHVVLPPVVGCLPKTWLTKGGGGVTGTPGPPLGYAPDVTRSCKEPIMVRVTSGQKLCTEIINISCIGNFCATVLIIFSK